MAWTISQDGSTMTGMTSFSDTGRGMMGNGTMRGTVNGRTLTFHMDVPNGGFSGMMSSCAMSMDGQATMSDDGRTMTGTYSGSMSGMMSGGMMSGGMMSGGMMSGGMMSGGMTNQSCGGSMNNGHFTLTR